MSPAATIPLPATDSQATPITSFIRLLNALRDNDGPAARAARRQLRALGFEVRLRRPAGGAP